MEHVLHGNVDSPTGGALLGCLTHWKAL